MSEVTGPAAAPGQGRQYAPKESARNTGDPKAHAQERKEELRKMTGTGIAGGGPLKWSDLGAALVAALRRPHRGAHKGRPYGSEDVCRGGPCGRPMAAEAALINCQTRGGDSGSSRGSTRSEASAAATALAITPPTGMMPPSPAPLAPSGLWGAGFSSRATARMRGKSLPAPMML
jgi:hypothetical protein